MTGRQIASVLSDIQTFLELKVAETFRVLEALYPGRIDLGIGRAPGSDPRTAQALQHGPGSLPIEYYPAQIADLLAYLGPGLAPDHPFAGVRAMPAASTAPDFWVLGSSDQSAAYAAHFGAAFSFAHFITERMGPEIMQAYRDAFQPSALNAKPRGSIGVFVLCADTEAEAERLASSRDLWRLRLDYGKITQVPSVEEALAYPYSDAERARIAHNRRRQIVGTPEQVRLKLLELGQRYGVDEFVVVSICYDFAARKRSYTLLAEAFALAPAAIEAD